MNEGTCDLCMQVKPGKAYSGEDVVFVCHECRADYAEAEVERLADRVKDAEQVRREREELYARHQEAARKLRDAQRCGGGSDLAMHGRIGYYDGPGDQPAHDPGVVGTPCLVCLRPLAEGRRKTISLMPEGASRWSYFFRVHTRCWDDLGPDKQSAYESSVIDRAVLRDESEGTDG